MKILDQIKHKEEIRDAYHRGFIEGFGDDHLPEPKEIEPFKDSSNMNKEDCWHPVVNEEGLANLPGEEYDWVLVKIKEMITGKPCSVPHIAEFRMGDGRWWSLETDSPYRSSFLPFEVTHWRPIPGDDF